MKKIASDVVYEQLKQKILDGELTPSQRLVEVALSQDLGAGRHKIRTALERLHSDGLVEIEPNRGATVRSLELAEVLDILVAREALEADVARLAGQRIETEQVQQLEAYLDVMQSALDNGEYDRYSATNMSFHQAIYAASGNETMPQLINTLRQRLARLQVRTILIPGRAEQSINEHKAILRALRSRDVIEAEAASRKHMSSLRGAIEKAWALVKS